MNETAVLQMQRVMNRVRCLETLFCMEAEVEPAWTYLRRVSRQRTRFIARTNLD